MCTQFPIISPSGTPFGPNGCQVPVGNGICGETRTLDIVQEFRKIYEEKLHDIEVGGGDCLQEKVRVQQEWIGDLTAQNEMLIRAVEELEREAAERVHLLEQKLDSSAKCICEVMKKYREHDFTNSILEEPLRRVFCLENDQKNLLEFIRRIREGGKWSVNGLTFFEVNPLVLLGNSISLQGCLTKETVEEQEKVKAAECQIQGLQESINHMKSFGDCEVLCQDLKRKNEECNKLMQTIKELRHSMKDEAASSHEKITQLKKKCQTLEERVTHAERQTSLREDIIQELKREINQLQHQISFPEKPFKNCPPPEQMSRKRSQGEPYLVINHTRKIVQSGKSTVIYLKSDTDEKIKTKKNAEHTSCCSRCRQKLHENKKEELPNSLYVCKSENDLTDIRKMLKPVKERSKLTNTTLNRCNTFLGCTSDMIRKEFEAKIRQRNAAVPNHVPVMTYVNNIEVATSSDKESS